MAANYWLSTQCNHWLLDRTQLDLARKEDVLYASPEELAAIQIWISNQAIYLCKRLALRQRVVATACVFLRRFFAKNSYCAVDLLLTIAACVYVAAKVEESPVHIKSICAEASRHFEQLGSRNFHADISSVAEMEFHLLEELEFDLIIYHPYRSLVAIYEQVGAPAMQARSKTRSAETSAIGSRAGTGGGAAAVGLGLSGGSGLRGDAEVDAGLFPQGLGDDSTAELGIAELDETTVQLAWFIINDSYSTDLPLMHPPHLIAIAAIWMALLLHPASQKKLTSSAEEMEQQRARWRKEVQETLEGVGSSHDEASGQTNASSSSSSSITTSAQQSKATPATAAASSGANQGRSAASRTATPSSATSIGAAGTVQELISTSLPDPPAPPSNETLTWLASLNVSIATVAGIVQDLVKAYDREAKVRKASQDGPEMIKRLERMRDARRKRLIRELAHAI
ncbi:uncharacterized protein PFL1_06644 [Pseudozyma flocculosa PF-1]|uniref:Related to SSN8 - DNA-directed RNA polymerase II holoenzyme and SRB subcomplex subunit, cyclin C homolog n=2 Tax=Pseudozyma flocculosa TaxID=84751 RepID=A0A5C3F8W7_9BASI|nr:uncharacterized protein PFL1_06644 [Pseudozyma flocculosa PF-1]EPQ25777.1 hypothetical protein PFL1_06644 [Pseudozyma flocculosa PF-1]SPO40526.1 related to SSN8 - DNA-directed RNA polymerase II holoenzyme and SRB subcomplex subunit, cyclin C homolog [Pseudozyma flocculosa]